MNRRILIALVLCTLMLGILGAGVVTAKQDERAPQVDRVQQFDVTYEGKEVGRLQVNARQLTFAFQGHGLPEDTYYLVCKPYMRSLGSARSTAGGTVRIQGDTSKWVGVLATLPTFELSTTPPPPQGYVAPVALTATWKITATGQKLSGRLQDAETGLPIANAPVLFKFWVKKTASYPDTYTQYHESSSIYQYYTWPVVTDKDGYYTYTKSGVPLGDAANYPPWVQFKGMVSPYNSEIEWGVKEVLATKI